MNSKFESEIVILIQNKGCKVIMFVDGKFKYYIMNQICDN